MCADKRKKDGGNRNGSDKRQRVGRHCKTINERGEIIDKPHFELVTDAGKLAQQKNGVIMPDSEISLDLANKEIDAIEKLCLNLSKYSQIKENPVWQHLYHYDNRPLPFLNSEGKSKNNVQPIPTYPCHYCGIVLPVQFVEIDHRQPKSKPSIAVLKIIRAINSAYVKARDKQGTKSNGISEIIHALNSKTTISLRVPINERSFGQTWAGNSFKDNQQEQRYSISSKGETFLSYFEQQRKDKYIRLCVNSMLNLVPSCRSCNGAKSNKAYSS